MVKASNSRMLRINNKNKILWKLFNNGAMSRIALSKECNLTGAAVTIITKNLLAEGFLIENGEKLQRNTLGRKEVLLDINYPNFLACNVNIERDKAIISLCSLKEVLKEEIIITKENLIKEIINRIKKVIKNNQDKTLGIGLGVIGTVDEEKGILINSYGLFKEKFPIKDILLEEFQMPVYVSNNVRAHARAIIDDINKDFLYIKHGAGLGSAIIANGEILQGFNNMAGEIGHTFPDYNDINNLEKYISEKEMLKILNQEKSISDIEEFYNLYGTNSRITCIIDQSIDKLVLSVINTAIVLDPQKIIVSGGLFDNTTTYSAFLKKYNSTDFSKRYEIKQLPNTNIKSIANARLVFNKKFFSF